MLTILSNIDNMLAEIDWEYPMEQRMTSTEVQSRFTDLLSALRSGPVEIVRYDAPVAVALSPEIYAALREAADQGLIARIRAAEAEGYLSIEESDAVMAESRARAKRMIDAAP